MMYDRLLNILVEMNRGAALHARNKEASDVIKRNPGTAMGPSGEKPHTSPYKVATARMFLRGVPVPQRPESESPESNTLPRPVRRRTAAQDREAAAAKLASSRAARARRRKGRGRGR